MVSAVLIGNVLAGLYDAITAWNSQSQHPLAGRLDLQNLGMSGHSFGAVTTEAVSGEGFPRLAVYPALHGAPKYDRHEHIAGTRQKWVPGFGF